MSNKTKDEDRIQISHGTRYAYTVHMCRCVDCKRANAEYQNTRKHASAWKGNPDVFIRRTESVYEFETVYGKVTVTPEDVLEAIRNNIPTIKREAVRAALNRLQTQTSLTE